MNCKQTREAVDSSSRRAEYGGAANSHLSGCADCRRHADETDSLLALLKAQPRVEAPADFEFRLRARIARAEAEQLSSAGVRGGVWERFLAQTFSWGQAATAMAAVGLVVLVSTVYFRHDSGAPVTAGKDVAVAIGKNTTERTQPIFVPRLEANPRAGAPIRSIPARPANRVVKAMPAVIRPGRSEASAEAVSFKDVASADSLPRFYSRETRQVVQDRNAFGAELVSVNTSKSAALTPSF